MWYPKDLLGEWALGELRNGQLFIVHRNEMYTVYKVYSLSEYSQQLKHNTEPAWDVIKVYGRVKNPLAYLVENVVPMKSLCIWQRDDIDWENVPIDTPVYCIDENGKKFPRHFAGVEEGRLMAFTSGRTSFTAEGAASWPYMELAEDKNDHSY